MPRNLELKAAFRSLDHAEICAKRLRARNAGQLQQTDTYFNISSGRLKLREERSKAELVFYDRPNIKGNRYSHYSIIPVPDPKKLKALLLKLFGGKVVVRKTRTLYRLPEARIHLDRVQGLGSFIEFEVFVLHGRRRAERHMKLLRQAFAIREDSIIAASYADLLLRKRRKQKGI